jgi:hypothetical protein
MNYTKLKDWNNGFVEWVLRRHPHGNRKQNGFMGGFLFGERGTGKSTFCYKTMAKAYYHYRGYNGSDDEEEAYKEALQYMLFDPSDFRNLIIRNKINRHVSLIICLDDASMHFGNMLHMTDPKLYAALLGETATIRTVVTGFMINAPKRGHVAKFLRDYDDYKGETKVDQGAETVDRENWNRKVRFYRWHYYPDEVKYTIEIPFQNKYSCYIPEPYYSWYIDKKNYYEIKHELAIADKVDKMARKVFIEEKNKLPSEFKDIVSKWEAEKNDGG